MIGDRIKRARLSMGLSLRRLAAQVNLSHSAIQKYEKGMDVPSSGVLLRLAEVLDVGFDYFFKENKVRLSNPNFRKRYKLGKKNQRKLISEAEEFLEKYLFLEGLFPSIVSSFRMPKAAAKKVKKLSDCEIIAESIRDEWNFGYDPIFPLIEGLESKGIKVVLLDIRMDSFDGCSAWINENLPAIIISKNWPGDRQRFTIAHELGHLLLKKDNPELKDEQIANRFAGAFLIPREAVYFELGQHRHSFYIKELEELKLRYGASIGCWLHRANDLGIISDSFYRRIMIDFGKKGWRMEEPGQQLDPEKPQRFERLIFKSLAENIISENKAAELFNISISKLRQNSGRIGGKQNEIPNCS